MTAKFELEGQHEPVLVVKPEWGNESILAAAFIRYDANLFSVYVERSDSGHITSLTFRASQAS